MSRVRNGALLLCAALLATTAEAQWLNLPTPGLPRLPDGKPNLAAPTPRTADGKPDLSGLWENAGGDYYYNNITADLRPEDVAPWADALYRKRRLEFGKDSMETRCLPMGPALTTTRYRQARIVQTPTLIAFLYDDLTHREIFLDGRALESDPNPTWMGYSVGRWEGDTLVVDSNGYTDRSWLDFDGHPHTEGLRITERYTRRDIGHIDVRVTMVDPAAYLKPITFPMVMELQTDTELLESVCENNKNLSRMAAVPAATAVDVPTGTLARYVGVYDVRGDGPKVFAAHVTLEGRSLWLDFAGRGKEELVALSPTTFSWSGSIITFTADAATSTLSIDSVEGRDHGTRRPQ